MTANIKTIEALLVEPFDASEIKWRVGAVSGSRAQALAYVDARCVMDRLDEVVGVAGWQDSYQILDDGNVVCTLRVRFGTEWITKSDVGGESEQKDEGDRRKAAFSDALKRAAVKFGVGRHLYRLPVQWCDYDPAKRQFVRQPTLPQNHAKPAPQQAPAKQTPLANPPRPDESGMEPDTMIPADMQHYLTQAIIAKGYEVAKFCSKRGIKSLRELNFGQYREALAALERAPRAGATA